MKTQISILIICILLVQPVSADKFNLVWTDVFPACAENSEGYDMVRCGCEFMVPNFHIGMIGNMLFKMILSFFEPLIDMTNAISDIFKSDDSLPRVEGQITLTSILGFLVDAAMHPILTTEKLIDFSHEKINELSDTSPAALGTLAISYLMDWIFGIITPFFVIILLLTIEFTKTYLLLAIPFALITHLLMEIKLINGASPTWGIVIALFSVIFMFVGSIWLLGSDMALYKPLVIW